jgi:small subunit ribosomal protein S4
MLLKKINNYKPLYKQFIKLKENIQDRKKVFNFKKQKWKFFIQNYRKKLRRYSKFKPQTQTQFTVSKFSNKRNSYRKRYLNTLHATKRFKLFYGGLGRKTFKKNIDLVTKNKKNYKKHLKVGLLVLESFEKRLDIILHRSKFSPSVRNARQLISHGTILVNNRKTQSKSFVLETGDFVTVNPKYHHLIEKNLRDLKVWPVPPKHLTINYKTLQILLGSLKDTNFSTNFTVNLYIEKIIHY